MVLCGVYWIVNIMAGEEEGEGLELGRVSSLFGYCMLPLVIHAAAVVLVPARWFICPTNPCTPGPRHRAHPDTDTYIVCASGARMRNTHIVHL
jgi:hypothetical protein